MGFSQQQLHSLAQLWRQTEDKQRELVQESKQPLLLILQEQDRVERPARDQGLGVFRVPLS